MIEDLRYTYTFEVTLRDIFPVSFFACSLSGVLVFSFCVRSRGVGKKILAYAQKRNE